MRSMVVVGDLYSLSTHLVADPPPWQSCFIEKKAKCIDIHELRDSRGQGLRAVLLTLHPQAANHEESLAGDQLICSVHLAAVLPQLFKSPCVPLLGPAASGYPYLSPESSDSRRG